MGDSWAKASDEAGIVNCDELATGTWAGWWWRWRLILGQKWTKVKLDRVAEVSIMSGKPMNWRGDSFSLQVSGRKHQVESGSWMVQLTSECGV